MKKLIAIILITVMMLHLVGCDSEYVEQDSEQEQTKKEKTPTKLVELDKYSDMTMDGTTSIEVEYQYQVSEMQIYEFVVKDQETIDEMMTTVFDIGLKEYPNALIDFYIRQITIKQGDKEYYIHMGYASDNSGKRYLCDAKSLREIIVDYIMDNLVE